MEKKTDRRKARTKRLLRTALLELIDEKGIDKTTVSDLTERADVNRGTFYLHYNDVFDFLYQIKQEIFEGLTKEMSVIHFLDVKQYAEKNMPYPPAVHILRYVAAHYDFFRVIFGPNGDAAFPLQVKAFMTEKLYNQMFAHISNDSSTPVPRDYLIAFLTSAQLGMLTHWIQTGMSLSVEEIAMVMTRILSKGPLLAAFS
jgi:AcrR family transcriptional regulator